MEASILNGTKKILGIAADYDVFDHDVMTHINSAFANLDHLGVGPEGGYVIIDDSATWDDLNLPLNQLSMVRTYIYLKTRMLFDPPTTSFHIEAMNKQILEHEWRLQTLADPPLEEEVV